jgi:hypothetical protein
MIVAAVVAIVLHNLRPGDDPVTFATTSLITAGITTVAWIAATFLTPAESEERLVAFYRRVRPTVHGWKKIAALAPEIPKVRDVASNAFDWVMGCVLVYATLFGIGKVIFGDWILGVLLLAVAAVAGYLIFWDLSRRGWQALSGTDQPAVTLEMESAQAQKNPS